MLGKIRDNFETAIKLEPSSPDAYVAYGQAMLASNHLKESIEAWESALQRMDKDTEPSTVAWAEGRLRWARYGELSMRRDALYAHGQGDLVESQRLVEEQLQIYADFPSRHHDLATIRVMLSDFLDRENDHLAVESFEYSQTSGLKAWMAGLLERNRWGTCHVQTENANSAVRIYAYIYIYIYLFIYLDTYICICIYIYMLTPPQNHPATT
eukprot:Skav232427  [mRNA]  locus=scaffold189:143649:144281:- [translate_table: standard]